MESKIRPMQELNKQIADSKSILNKNESRLTSHIMKYSTPQKSHQPQSYNSVTTKIKTPETNIKQESANEKDISNEQISNYINNLKKLCSQLQEKCYALEVDYRKNLVTYQYKQDQLQSQVASFNSKLKQINRDLAQREKEVIQLSKINKQKQQQVTRLSQQLTKLRNQNEQLKRQNKTYKADNKVIMSHIERLTNQNNSSKDNRNSLQERQYRVMKSLYQTNPNLGHGQPIKRYHAHSDLSNKIKLDDDSVQKNSDLKSLIRRLNQEIQILKRQKDSLVQECKIKTQNYQTQKLIAKMNEESNQKLNNLIMKMGDKIMTLQQFNQSLRKQLLKQEIPIQNYEENYYRTTKSKIGQFYYKK